MRARLREGKAKALQQALESGTLGQGSAAEGEYERNMNAARLALGGETEWIEVCFCQTPLEEERPCWEEYFELFSAKGAHRRSHCHHENGTQFWACLDCDCTAKLEARLTSRRKSFIDHLKSS